MIEIQTGYEVEYLPGEEENIMELKTETDKIVLGQHFIYDKDMKNLKILGEHEFTTENLLTLAEYMEKAMELGIPDIVAHPDFFLLHRGPFGELEGDRLMAEKICKAAEKYNIPLEMNLNNIGKTLNFRNGGLSEEEKNSKLKDVSYPSHGFWEFASKYDIKVVFGLDVHHKSQITHFPELVSLANKIIGKDIMEKLNFIEEM